MFAVHPRAPGRRLQRSTFIIDEEGTVAHVIPKASPKTHDDEVLKVLVLAILVFEDIAVAGVLGFEDRAAVVTEKFSQWVIEDCFTGPRPKWEAGGAQFAADVRSFETAKLRMLNGVESRPYTDTESIEAAMLQLMGQLFADRR